MRAEAELADLNAKGVRFIDDAINAIEYTLDHAKNKSTMTANDEFVSKILLWAIEFGLCGEVAIPGPKLTEMTTLKDALEADALAREAEAKGDVGVLCGDGVRDGGGHEWHDADSFAPQGLS